MTSRAAQRREEALAKVAESRIPYVVHLPTDALEELLSDPGNTYIDVPIGRDKMLRLKTRAAGGPS